MESSLVGRLFNWFGNDAAVANAQVLLETRDRNERAIAVLTDRLAPAGGDNDQNSVTTAA